MGDAWCYLQVWSILHVYMCAGGQCQMPFFTTLQLNILRQGLSLTMELSNEAKATIWWAPKIVLSRDPPILDTTPLRWQAHISIYGFYMGTGDLNSGSCLHGKHCTCWAISPGLHFQNLKVNRWGHFLEETQPSFFNKECLWKWPLRNFYRGALDWSERLIDVLYLCPCNGSFLPGNRQH